MTQRKWVLTIVAVLGIGAAVVAAVLLTRPLTAGRTEGLLAPNTLAQLDKLFQIVSDFHTELENVTAQASYPSDEEKLSAKNYLRTHTLLFEQVRLSYAHVKEQRTKGSVLLFFQTACSPILSCQIVSTPSFKKLGQGKFDRAGNYEPGKWVAYGNTSRLESFEDTFYVFAVATLREIKTGN